MCESPHLCSESIILDGRPLCLFSVVNGGLHQIHKVNPEPISRSCNDISKLGENVERFPCCKRVFGELSDGY